MFRVMTRLRFIEPQLASSVDQPPEGKHWIHEITHDGYRSQVLIERGKARVLTRNGYDWTTVIPPSSEQLLTFAASRQSSMARQSSKTVMALPTLRRLALRCGGNLTASSYMRLICSISMAGTFANKHSLSVEPA